MERSPVVVYDAEITNYDVLLLPMNESCLNVNMNNMGLDDLASIVEGIEYEDEDEIPCVSGGVPRVGARVSHPQPSSAMMPLSVGDASGDVRMTQIDDPHPRSAFQLGSGPVTNHYLDNDVLNQLAGGVGVGGADSFGRPFPQQNHATGTPVSIAPIKVPDELTSEHGNEHSVSTLTASAAPMDIYQDSALEAALKNIMPDPLPTVHFASQKHPGNNRFYVVLSSHRQKFMNALSSGNNQLCDTIAEKIVKTVCKDSVPPGRFLECTVEGWSKADKEWKNLGQGKQVTELVKWALREPPLAQVSLLLTTVNKSAQHSKSSTHLDNQILQPLSNLEFSQEPSIDKNHLFNQIKNNNNDNTSQHYQDVHTTTAAAAAVTSAPSSFQSKFFSPRFNNTCSEDGSWEEESFNESSNNSSKGSSLYFSNSSNRKSSNRNKRTSGNSTSDNSNRRGSNKLKRRGTISSQGPTKFRSKINLADFRYSVGGQLSKLVEEVFAEPLKTETTFVSEHSSAGSKSKRPRKSRTRKDDSTYKKSKSSHSSNTTMISDLRCEFGHVKIGPVNQKLERDWSDMHVKKIDGTIRILGEYDVLCITKPSYAILFVNHLGNNRLRTMLQMHSRTFHNLQTSAIEKNRISAEIINQVLCGKKGRGKFLRESENLWVEMEVEELTPMVLYFLHHCAADPTLGLPNLYLTMQQQSSPSSLNAKSLTAPLHEKHDLYKGLHNAALNSVKRRKNRKTFVGLSDDAINQLQEKMIASSRKSQS